jgi:hypothetical protein
MKLEQSVSVKQTIRIDIIQPNKHLNCDEKKNKYLDGKVSQKHLSDRRFDKYLQKICLIIYFTTTALPCLSTFSPCFFLASSQQWQRAKSLEKVLKNAQHILRLSLFPSFFLLVSFFSMTNRQLLRRSDYARFATN